jgi:LPPG:FO 2-phospho-L-lactate transferase
MRVTALAGGTGAAKLLRGLAACLAPGDLTVVVNTGDDTEVWGLHVSPDLDTVTYALAGRLDRARGWGLAGETFRCRDAMAALGAPTWFNLGDADLATHLLRTERLRAGEPLSAVTAALARRFGVQATILPMTDDPVRTRLRVAQGWLAFQEFFVREQARPAVLDVAYDGAAAARPGPGVVEALLGADLVVVCPSNPVTSIGPILAVPRMVEALCSTRAPIVAVSPIVGDAPVSGPAGTLMRARGLPVSVAGVAEAYRPWLDCLIIDRTDAARRPDVERRGVRAAVTDIVMTDDVRERALARFVLEEAPVPQGGPRASAARPGV